MRDLKIDLNGSGGHVNVKPGYSCGDAVSGILIELESTVPASRRGTGNLWHHGGVMSRKNMKKLRDLIDAELAKPIKNKR